MLKIPDRIFPEVLFFRKFADVIIRRAYSPLKFKKNVA